MKTFSFASASYAIASINVLSEKLQVAQAHAILHRFCDSISDILRRNSADIACIRGTLHIYILAKAKDVFARLCVPNSDILRRDSADIEYMSGLLIMISSANAQAVFAIACGIH